MFNTKPCVCEWRQRLGSGAWVVGGEIKSSLQCKDCQETQAFLMPQAFPLPASSYKKSPVLGTFLKAGAESAHLFCSGICFIHLP